MRLHLSPETLASVDEIEDSYGKLGIIVNDTYSFDEELRLRDEKHKEGGHLLNMVEQMAKDTGSSYAAAKRVLWTLCREWELEHQELVKAREAVKGGSDEDLRLYLLALEYVLSGNKKWSQYMERYHKRN